MPRKPKYIVFVPLRVTKAQKTEMDRRVTAGNYKSLAQYARFRLAGEKR